MLVSLTVGKVDAGVTVLLTPDKRLIIANEATPQIEFPSILLPPNISSGSIVDINVSQNTTKESAEEAKFRALQERIYASFGAAEPSTPVLRCRNATQTSVVLEWDPVALATADLVSLTLYRNGQKAGQIPRPLAMHSTKISGLAVDTEYAFHLVLRTSAGTRTSERVAVRTHKMTDLSGVTVTPGLLPAAQREALARAVTRIGARIVADGSVRIDTTHFVTTEGRGTAWEKAVENNIPVVRPEWVDACEKAGRILGVTKFYLDAMRPGPPSDPTPTSTPPPVQKDQPPPPPPEADDESVVEGHEDAAANGKTEEQQQPSGAEDEPAEPKARRPDHDEEQKMRLEDKDGQKLALRPAEASKVSLAEGEYDADARKESSEDKEEQGDEKEVKQPGSTQDGDSFQEVQL
ncbi:brct domain containing protein [Cordyceps fumosorosea ARSEF 2679]|uniref:Brct domain containing protein n=1 Tax=Cordyceps fumosorosea (strain ARSEF 2679) TaxID=1081104 RepID=A0A167NL95_CORFA|nr:brct domain containing protein [Cordyceps fumosorosea ARSEF 2679]OAA55681.1 brct domain containing protein [Cordyceps fumosorosea ARSEF 2679]